MDSKKFYGLSKAANVKLRAIPSDSEDSELSDDESPNEEVLVDRDQLPDVEIAASESDEEDNIPLRQLVPQTNVQNKRQKKKPIQKWKKSVTEKNDDSVKFQGNELLPNEILKLNSPYKLFRHFFTENFVTRIVKQTCIYSVQKKPSKPLTTSVQEIQRFFGVILWMSLIKQPSTRRYWSPKTRIPQVADVMTVNRFELLKSLLHFNDNTESTNSLDKIMPVIEQIRKTCISIPLEENLSCDEQIIPFKGRISIKTYNPKKPHKWGYKMWVLSGVSGFSYNFELFAGKRGFTVDDNDPDFGSASNVVFRLCKSIPSGIHHKIFYDNYFSSLPLVSYLSKRKIHSVATIRTNRLSNYKGVSEKDMKKLGRGSIHEETTSFDGIDIHSVQWYDNKIVTLTSDYCGTRPILKVNRFFKSENTKKEIDCPDIVKQYNHHMGGVDLQDSLIGLYPIKLKSRKWYHRIFYHLLDCVTINCWLLDRRIKTQLGEKEKIIPLLQFKTVLAEQLCNIGIRGSNKRGRPSFGSVELPRKRRCLEKRPNKYIQNDSVGHWPKWTKERERCKLLGCKSKSRVSCKKCGIHLCCTSSKNCFVQFHTQEILNE